MSTHPQSARQGVPPAVRLAGARLAWSLCALVVVLLGCSVLLASLGRPGSLLEESAPWYGQAIFAAGSAGAPVLGALIASRHPENLYGWLWLSFGLALAVLSFGGNYAEYAALSGHLPAPVTAAAVGSAGWVAWVALMPFLVLLFPDGRPPSPRWRFVVRTVVAASAVCIVLGPFVPGQSSVASVENPFGVGGPAGVVVTALVAAGVFVIFGCTLLSALSLVFRFWRADGMQRQQIKWFTYAAVLFCGSLIFSGFLGQDLPGVWDALFEAVTLSGLYLAVGIAILKHRLYDIDIIINRTLVYGALTVCVVGAYILVVGYFGALLQTDDNLLVSLVATGVVAVLFQPLRERLQRGANRLMYGERDEPYAVVSRLGERLESTLAPGAVLPAIAATVREALRLPYAAVALPHDGDFEVAAASGQPLDESFRLPLTYQGETVGELLLGARAPDEEFSAADRRLLGDLAHHAGVAVHGVRVMADLRRSRERLVLAREEERRRLRRDLHDELAPTLAALGLAAATVGELIPADPKKAVALNAELQAEIRSAVGEVRRLVYDLRPPTLDELGLAEAVRQRAARYNASEENGGLRITVEASELPPELPAAVEVAAYRIVQEALMNVVRHAGASTCAVRLACPNGRTLDIEVTDDGVGMPESPEFGVGLRSMQERATELGGSCLIERAIPAGTRVFARLPLAEPAELGEA